MQLAVGLYLLIFLRACLLGHVSADETDCCILSCVVVEEERCENIINIGNQIYGKSAKRINVDQAFPKEGQNLRTVEDDVQAVKNQAMHKISQLQGSMSDMLNQFHKFSDETVKDFSGGDNATVHSMLDKLGKMNATFNQVAETLEGEGKFTCSKPEPALSRITDRLSGDTALLVSFCGMGMADGRIPDSALSMSSSYPAIDSVNGIRLDHTESWVSQTTSNVQEEWIQADLGETMQVSGIITQGAYNRGHWTISYNVACGDSMTSLEFIKEAGVKKVFAGNVDANTKVINRLPDMISCRFVRIYAVTVSSNMGMRMELLYGDCFAYY